jgi:transposase
MMFGISATTKIFVACGATDMRKSFGLYGLVEEKIEEDPLSGHLFVFCNRHRNRLKILFWDGSGFWVCAKRLEQGRFSWPISGERKTTMERDVFMMMLGGLEINKMERKRWYHR